LTVCSGDWSSDVCSSDLKLAETPTPTPPWRARPEERARHGGVGVGVSARFRQEHERFLERRPVDGAPERDLDAMHHVAVFVADRSEERPVRRYSEGVGER